MPNLAAHAALAQSDVLHRRLQAALVQRATAAANAPRPTVDAELPAWRARRRLARDVLASPDAYVARFAWQVAGHADVLTALASAAVRGNPAQLDDAPLETALDAAISTWVAVRDDSAPAPAP